MNDLKESDIEPFFKKILKSLKKENSDEIHCCICVICKKENFTEYRYKCLLCDDYNMCGECFEKKNVSQSHVFSHPVIRFDTPNEIFGLDCQNFRINLNLIKIFLKNFNHNQACSICNNNIDGINFKCDLCHEFNVCFNCYETKKDFQNHLFESHTLIIHDNNTSNYLLNSKDIELQSELGSGSFGSVYKAKLKNINKIVACKIIKVEKNASKSDDLYQSYLKELKAYNELKGINILRMIGHSYDTVNELNHLMIITEYMTKGSLESLLKNEPELSLRKRLFIACGISSGMARIHERNYTHRDIRPDNILVTNNYLAKIGDMGIMQFKKTQENKIGCIAYMPPEFYDNNYNEKLDIYTFGLTLNELFDGEHIVKRKVLYPELEERYEIKIKNEACCLFEIIKSCIDLSPEKRPKADDLKRKLHAMKILIDFIICEYRSDYILMSTEDKNKIFKECENLIKNSLRYL